jgi:hypothetical protein
LTIRIASSRKAVTHAWRTPGTWVFLSLYLLTGPVLEAVHSEPHCLTSRAVAGAAVVPPGDGARQIPVDGSHVCVICTQLTERLTTPAVPYQLSVLRIVSHLAVTVISELPGSVRYLSPDKRGPPSPRA